MVDQDGRTTNATDMGFDQPFDLYHMAAEGDRVAAVELWHAGVPDRLYPRHLIDEMLLENRVGLLLECFTGTEAA